MRKWMAAIVGSGFLLGCLISSPGSPLVAPPPITQMHTIVLGSGAGGNTQGPLLASYTGPLGIVIRSYSTKWRSSMQLKAVYDELLTNLHGPEISKLSTVNLYATGGGGLYHSEFYVQGAQHIYASDRSIDLFGVDQALSIDDLARTLAHEYGHHFTMYYLWVKEGHSFDDTDWDQAGWAQLRHTSDFPDMGPTSSEHAWQPAEIEAEDYAQLYGSARAHKSTRFTDQTRLFSNNMHNLDPQENLYLPLAAEVTGLRSYWLNLSRLTMPLDYPPTQPMLQLSGETTVAEGRSLQFSWSQAQDPERRPLEYTLVSYTDPTKLPFGYRTLMDQAHANITVNQTDQETFRLFVKDAAGNVVSSNGVTLDLSQPVPPSGQPGDLLPLPEWVQMERPASVPHVLAPDLSPTFWAATSIDLMVAAGWMRGYPSGQFKPNGSVTRAEFLTMLSRAFPMPSGPLGLRFLDVAKTHWAYDLILRARALGLTDDAGGLFEPDRPITRAEMALLFARFLYQPDLGALVGCAGGNPTTFPDVAGHLTSPRLADAETAIGCLVHHGLLKGLPDGTFGARRSLTRAEAATALARLMDARLP